jgi:hypothetical protein
VVIVALPQLVTSGSMLMSKWFHPLIDSFGGLGPYKIASASMGKCLSWHEGLVGRLCACSCHFQIF